MKYDNPQVYHFEEYDFNNDFNNLIFFTSQELFDNNPDKYIELYEYVMIHDFQDKELFLKALKLVDNLEEEIEIRKYNL